MGITVTDRSLSIEGMMNTSCLFAAHIKNKKKQNENLGVSGLPFTISFSKQSKEIFPQKAPKMLMDTSSSVLGHDSPKSPLGPTKGTSGSQFGYHFKAKCAKCGTEWPLGKPPRNWDCNRCNSKTWQPDDASDNCLVCRAAVGKFTRHHCRQCGLITCTPCTVHQIVIPDFGPEKQRVCSRCAVPNVAPSKSGTLQKLAQKNTFFGEKFQTRFFELRGTVLLYGKERGDKMNGQIDISGCRVMDVAIHPNAFCLIGPKLQRGYVLSADTRELKAEWVAAINKEVSQAQSSTAAADEDDEGKTEAVLFNEDQPDIDQPMVCMNDFEIMTVLGLGSFGRVMKVKRKRTGEIFAMKVLDKQQIVANRMVTHTHSEKTILTEVRHPFIVKLHFAFQTKRHLVLVLDFLCGGELFFHLQRCKKFSEQRAKFYAAEIGLALETIHANKIIYRDLKPENLVLDRAGHVTLTDFGLAKRDVRDTTHTFCGTPEYMAPELIQKKGHGYAVDWWSLGIFLYEMVSGLPPFYTQNVTEMYELILNRPLTFPNHFSADLKHLLTRLLDRDPEKRMQSGEEFKKHPFFRDINFDRLLRREITPEFVPDVTNNDLKYFDKQFTQESTKVAHLDQPNDPHDANSKRFEGFDFNATASTTSSGSPKMGPTASPKEKSVPREELL